MAALDDQRVVIERIIKFKKVNGARATNANVQGAITHCGQCMKTTDQCINQAKAWLRNS